MRDGIKALIEQSGEFRVVAEAEKGAEALELFKSVHPELVLVGIGTPAANGAEAAKQILHHSTTAPLVMLALGTDEDAVVNGLQCGARGIVLKKDSSQNLLEALRVVAGGGSYFSAQMSRSYEQLNLRNLNGTVRNPLAKRLTNREMEVETIRSYRKSMMRKLGVRNIASLIHVAFEEGITHWTKAGSGSYT
jgi:DNA-binding NarL/FixJ family response regulator